MGSYAPSSSPHPWRAPDPKYLFHFLNADGSLTTWNIYWDELYAARWRNRLCLAAARLVPHSDFLFAFYLAQKHASAPIHHAALPELPRSPGGDDIVKGPVELIPFDPSPLVPREITQQASLALQETVNLTVAQQVPWLMPYLPSSAPSISPATTMAMSPFGVPAQATQAFSSSGGAGMDALVQLDPRVMVSYGIDAAIKERMTAIVEEQTVGSDSSTALALRTGLKDELRKRLYSDPQYLTLLKWVMEAEGSFASPMVTDFLTYYFERIKERVETLSINGEFDPTFWEERLQSAIARAEATAQGAKPYRLLTLLGFVKAGEVSEEERLPHCRERVFPVDPRVDLGAVRLSHLSPLARRGMEMLIRTCLTYINIEDVRCLGEEMRDEG